MKKRVFAFGAFILCLLFVDAKPIIGKTGALIFRGYDRERSCSINGGGILFWNGMNCCSSPITLTIRVSNNGGTSVTKTYNLSRLEGTPQESMEANNCEPPVKYELWASVDYRWIDDENNWIAYVQYAASSASEDGSLLLNK